MSEPSSTATQDNKIGPTYPRCARNEARRTQGVRTRILIIDDDRRSPVRLHRLEAGGAANGATAGKARRNGGRPGAGANGSADRTTLAQPEHAGDLGARGAVLDMDAALVRDVLARVQELLAQAEPDGTGGEEPESAESGHAGIVIDLPTQTVWRSGRPVRVTPTEFRLLVALVRRRGAVVSREDLRREVWPDGTEVQSRVIDSHIARLRRKLEHDPKQPRHILTALAAGYRFLA
ncbi:MAG TPA: winged helix-turn-helix domain-containing protein [Gemmatimonadales bacterium]